jgi:hypothetical protein
MRNTRSLTHLRRTLMLVTPLLTIATAVAQAEQSHTLLANGPSDNRIDIVLIGDGYTAAQLGTFADDVSAFVGRMFAQSPFQTYRPYFNVRYVDVVSPQSGADHPEIGAAANTALNSTYNCAEIQRLICVDTSAVEDVLLRSVGPDQRDVVIVLVNDPEYGGSGGSLAVSSVHGESAEIVLHELGHSFGLLADEYSGGGPTCDNQHEPAEPNVTLMTSRSKIKWGEWIDANTRVPTRTVYPADPGLYEGGKYCETAIYRPTYESKMRTLGAPFEQVNTEQLVKRIYNLVAPIDEALPSGLRVAVAQGERVQFSVRAVRPADHDLRIRWTVDGRPVSGAAALAIDTVALTTSDHQVTVTVTDTTAFVRTDPAQLLSQSHTWTLQVGARTPPLVSTASDIQALLRELREFNPSTPLRHSLETQLEGALSAYLRGNAVTTCGKLRAFTQHIGSAAGRRLAHTQRLHAGASALMLTVGCSARSEP